jgi:enoyl-CoA hydratase/carnithine racemase
MSPPTGQVRFDAADAQGIARLTLSNPGKLNALSVAMWRELRAHFARVNAGAGDIRAIVVCGEDGHFASGGDIDEFADFRFDAATLARFHEEDVRPALQAMLACDVPLVAQIDGACIGGGLEVAACCDLRIAGQGSRFGVPIARLGFPMAPAELQIVAGVIGATVLREMLIEARVWDAQEAMARGLLSCVVADDQVAARARASAQRIAALSPQALQLNKRALRQFAPAASSSAADRAPHYAYAAGREHREGLAAFSEKRKPRF